ncbi:MAG: glycine--tRNA ligase subunit beta [Pseudomonadota bacterium]
MEQDLLLEIGTEEIPARFIPGALQSLNELARQRAKQARLPYREVMTMGTPRRLTLVMLGLSASQADMEETIMGPPKTAAFSPDGTPTKVALGFAKAKGIPVQELEFIETPKGVYLGIKKTIPGLPTVTVLSELLPQLILELPFPKFMRWGSSPLRFARPIHWLVALFGDQVVPFSLGEIVSGNRTYGHRFMAPQAIELKGAQDYPERLRQAWVIVDPKEREEILHKEIEALAVGSGGRVLTDPELLQEVNYLVEFPEPVSGGFNPDFLRLPPEVLITSMKEHQRYFPLVDGQGHLLPRFIAVNNTRVHDTDRVVKGHEKVLRARLSDARFFFQEDLKEPLSKKMEALKGVVFHSRLGTSFEKVERIVALSTYLSRTLAPEKEELVRRASWLCKADLTSLMVGEFPDLQGIMGREYARRSGEPEEVAQGIFEHYLPSSLGSSLPQTTTGALVGLADRLDTLVGFFGLAQIPTGSADPYALRRQAQAVIVIIWDRGYSLSVDETLTQAIASYPGRFKEDPLAIKKTLVDFFALRLQHLLEGEGLGRETIESVLSARWDDFLEVRLRAQALQSFQNHPDFSSLAMGCKRALNILKGLSPSEAGKVNSELFLEEQEKQLYEKVLEKEAVLQGLFQQKGYSEYLLQLAQLRPAIDAFFDKVLVMAPEEKLRQNRLALLFQLTALFNRFALFSKYS